MAKLKQDSGWAALVCAVVGMGIAPARAQTATEVVLHNFGIQPHGAVPDAGVIRDSAGNLYGTTYQGGRGNAGVVYKVNNYGQQTVLYSFTGGADGGHPHAGLIADSAGDLYGTTTSGGKAGAGVVYKLDRAGHEKVLYSFTGGADGATPEAGVIRDSAGNLYGTTEYGGTAGAGVVYKLDAAGQETVLYSFTGGADGSNPLAGVIRDSAGNFYGTTGAGGTARWGVVFELDKAGQETVLHSFSGYYGADGGGPIAGVIRDSAGNLYGTTYYGGPVAAGVVYKLDTAGNLTVLHSFTGQPGCCNTDGGGPMAGVVRDSAGNLYGTTERVGCVYMLDPAGNETLYMMTQQSRAGLTLDSAGNLYGTTIAGGPGNAGTVFELSAGHAYVLYAFPGTADGAGPLSGLIRDSAGNFYGTTYAGGTAAAGTVYKLDTAGQVSVLYSFAGAGAADGGEPFAGVIRDSAGNLYGTTYDGGFGSFGVVYKLDTAGQETVLYTFSAGKPTSGVIRDPAGNLYGTDGGGVAGWGLVYKLDTAGQETALYTFTGGADGGVPNGLIRDSAGTLFGTTAAGGTGTAGVVYKLDMAGNETVLYSFTGGADGGIPGALIRDSAGNLYGIGYSGGAANAGVVFKLDTAGQETVRYSFTGGADGANPNSALVRDSAGNLYGTTQHGGAAGAGVVFEVDAAGQETVLYSFAGGADGGSPNGVIRDAAGHLYGTAYSGGKYGSGVIFELKPQ
jgi:uncharacterized repeat protein (TIGR03803 family)